MEKENECLYLEKIIIRTKTIAWIYTNTIQISLWCFKKYIILKSHRSGTY